MSDTHQWLATLPTPVEHIVPIIESPIEKGTQLCTLSKVFYVNYPFDKSNLLPAFAQNSVTLLSLQDMLDEIRNKTDFSTIKQITITGYASPEGHPVYNDRLAHKRALSFYQHVSTQVTFPEEIVNIASGGEDWDGLLAALAQNPFNNSEELSQLIQNSNDRFKLKQDLQNHNQGKTYRYLLRNIYPLLRKVVCTIEYEIIK